jgi:hypothetical protein
MRVAGAVALLLATTVIGTVNAGIYPADHWSYSTKLTSDSFKGFVKKEIKAGKTAFVRFIASQG